MNKITVLLFTLLVLNSAAIAEEAIFAGGCFWCVEADLEKVEGVKEVVSGYSGGTVSNPSYKDVSAGGTGHYEVVKVNYNPKIISYKKLVDKFWTLVDPLDARGQFCDKGNQYRSAVFYGNDEEKAIAEASKSDLEKQLGEKVATELLPAAPFYKAEDYHQNYYKTHSIRYSFYRYRCGRDARLNQLKKRLEKN